MNSQTNTAGALSSSPDLTGREERGVDDRKLVFRYLDGDPTAFDELMTRHQRAVFHVCLRFVKNHDDALDLTQEVFIKAFERLDGFRGDSAFRTWIYRVAVNHCLNFVKKNSPEFTEVGEHTGSVAPSAHGTLLRGERREIVRRLIETLPPKQKIIFQLRMQDNLSYEEIADVVGRSVSTVKSSVFFAMTKLRKLAGNDPGTPDRSSRR